MLMIYLGTGVNDGHTWHCLWRQYIVPRTTLYINSTSCLCKCSSPINSLATLIAVVPLEKIFSLLFVQIKALSSKFWNSDSVSLFSYQSSAWHFGELMMLGLTLQVVLSELRKVPMPTLWVFAPLAKFLATRKVWYCTSLTTGVYLTHKDNKQCIFSTMKSRKGANYRVLGLLESYFLFILGPHQAKFGAYSWFCVQG